MKAFLLAFRSTYRRLLAVLAPVLLCLSPISGVYAQNAVVGTGFSSGWGSACSNATNYKYLSAGTGTTYILTTTASGTGNQYWRFGVDWGGTFKQLTITPGTDVLVSPNTTYSLNGTCTSTGSLYYNVPNVSYNYIFKTLNAGTSPTGSVVFFEVQGAVRSVSSVSTSGTAIPGQPFTVSATLSGAFSTGQAAYLRYSTDNWSSSSVVQMTGSGTSYSANVPGSGNAAGNTVRYYVFTSGTANVASNGSNADLYTINLNNNGGSNYSYTVASAHTSVANGNWSSPGTWTGGVVPASGVPVTIQAGHTITLDQDATVGGMTISSTGTLIGSDGLTRTLTVSGGSTFTATGSYTQTGSGLLKFSAGGSLTGSGATTLQDLTVQGAGLNLGSATTVTGTLTIGGGGAISSSNLSYGSNGNLVYSTGGTYNVSNEWPTSSGPKNVTISTTTLQITKNLSLAGNLTIASSGALMPPVSATGNHTLTMSGTGATFDNQGNIQAYTDATHTWGLSVTGSLTLKGTDGTGGGTANNTWRMYDITVGSGATLQASATSGQNCIFEIDHGTLSNSGTINFSRTSAGGSRVNMTIRGTSGNVVSLTGSGTTILHGCIVGQSSQLNLGSNIIVKNFMTVAGGSPLGQMYPVGNKTITFRGNASTVYYTQLGTVDPNPSFGNTLNLKADTGLLQIQSNIDVFSVNVGYGGTLRMWENTNDYNIYIRNGATVQVDSGGTLITGITASGNGYVSSTNGGGTFNLTAGGILVINGGAGLNSSGASGPVQTATRTFSSRSILSYNRTNGGFANLGTFTTTPLANTVKALYVQPASLALGLSMNLRVLHRVDILSGSINLGTNALTVDSILEMRDNQITGSAGGTVTANRFLRTSSSLGINLAGSAALILRDTGTVEYYASTGVQNLSPRTDYGHIKLTGAATKVSGGDITLQGNWSRSGGSLTPGSYKVSFTGTHASQTITASGGETFAKLEVNKASGSVSIANRVTVSDSVKLHSGKLYATADTLEMGSSANMVETIGATDHYVIGNLLTSRSVGTSYSNFGGIGVEFGSGANVGTVRVVRTAGSTGIVTGQGSCCSAHTSIARRWLIKPQNNPASPRVVTLKWPSEDDNGIDISAFQTWKSTDGSAPYARLGIIQNAGLAGDPRSISSYVSSFSMFTGADGGNFLPVTYQSFTAVPEKGAARLTFITTKEENVEGFYIERSRDGKLYTNIAYLEPKANPTDRNVYTLRDAELGQGAYYRVVEQDRDGKQTRTEARYVSGSKLSMRFSPNPTPAGTPMVFTSEVQGAHTLRIFSADGRLMQQAVVDAEHLSVWATEQAAVLPAGAYVLEVASPVSTERLRWMIAR